MERCASRSFGKQLQAALQSSDAQSYLHQLDLALPSGGNNLSEHITSHPLSRKGPSKSAEWPACLFAKRKLEDVSSMFAARTADDFKRRKKDQEDGGALPQEIKPKFQAASVHKLAGDGEQPDVPRRQLSKAARAERDSYLRAGAARYQEILQQGSDKHKPTLFERLSIREKGKKPEDIVCGEDASCEHTGEGVSLPPRRARQPPPVWSTSLQDLRAADELCPNKEEKRGKVAVKLSRGGIARAVLFANSEATQGQRLDGRGVIYFDITLSSTRGLAVKSLVDTKTLVGADSPSVSQKHRLMSISSLLSAPAPTPPLPPQRRTFVDRRMARSWVQQCATSEARSLVTAPKVLFWTLQDSTVPSQPAITAREPKIECSSEQRSDFVFNETNAAAQAVSLGPSTSNEEVLKAVLNPTIEGLIQAYELETPLFIFLSGRCRSKKANHSCDGHSCGLRLLPCSLPKRVEAVGVGWASISDVEILPGIRPTIRFLLKLHSVSRQEWWWLPAPTGEKGWKLSKKTPSPSQSARPHRPARLTSTFVCTACRSSIPRVKWKGWCCAHCGLFTPAGPLTPRQDVHWGKMPILTEGPRMDNGRVLCVPPVERKDIVTWSDGIKAIEYCLPLLRQRFSQGSTVRGPMAYQPSGTQSPPVAIRMHHFLSCGNWRRVCDRLLARFLDAEIPYERLSGSTGQLQAFFSLAMLLTAQVPMTLSPFPPSPVLDDKEYPSVAVVFLDAADEIEMLISRLNENDVSNDFAESTRDATSPRTNHSSESELLYPFSILTAVLSDDKSHLDISSPSATSPVTLSKQLAVASQHEGSKGRRKGQRAYVHLGSPATMLISSVRKSSTMSSTAIDSSIPSMADGSATAAATLAAAAVAVRGLDELKSKSKSHRRPFQVIFSCMVAHGDVILLQGVEERSEEYKIIIESSELHVGLVLV